MAGALRLVWIVGCEEEERFEGVETSGAGNGVFEANIAISMCISYTWSLVEADD